MATKIRHIALSVQDPEGTAKFYEEAFGWQMMPMPEMGYTIVMSGPSGDQGPSEPGFINGGMMQREEPFTAPNIVVDVANLEETLKAVNEAGGTTVTERQAVGEMGFTAYFKDSEGNLVGLWENAPSG